jgi:hypothetical protein
VNASQKWFSQVRDSLVAESTSHERSNRLVGVVAPGRNEDLGTHPKLGRPAEKSRPEKGSDPRRDTKHRSVGQRMKDSVPLNVGQTRRKRCNQPIPQAKLTTQLNRFRLLNEQGVWSTVNREPVDRFAEDYASGTVRGLEHDDRNVPAV